MKKDLVLHMVFLGAQMKNKKAELAWQYIAIIILGLIVVFAIIVFSTQIKEKLIEGISNFMQNVLGR